jgi:hypothetical protein
MGIRQVKRLVAGPRHIAGPQGVRPRPNHDQFNPLVTLQFDAKTSTLRPLQERECMSSVLKKRRKKMRKHKYKKLRRRQKFERRKS